MSAAVETEVRQGSVVQSSSKDVRKDVRKDVSGDVKPYGQARAPKVITRPPKSALIERGTVILRKALSGEAPSTAAARSNSRSTAANALIADLTKKGEATKISAMMTAICVKGISIPASVKYGPNRPRRPNVTKRATPATAGGSSMGKSTRVSTTGYPQQNGPESVAAPADTPTACRRRRSPP